MFFKKIWSKRKKKSSLDLQDAIVETGSVATSEQYSETLRYKDPQGHGFAAESLNNKVDRLLRRDASIVGSDNAKGGPDRLVEGVLIQTKTCASASETVGACFKDNQYFYVLDGEAIATEVPSDQYAEAVLLMKNRISNGEVPGVTDPAKASELIIKGYFSYETIRSIAQFCTIESLAWDAATGAVISTSIYSLSFMFTFSREIWHGTPPADALKEAYNFGLKPASVALIRHVATQQIARTPLSTVLGRSVTDIVKLLPAEVISNVASIGRTQPIFGAAATNHLTKIISGNVVMIFISSTIYFGLDIRSYRGNKITGARLSKNIVSNTAGGFSAATGARLGLSFGPIGAIFGGLLGFVIGKTATDFMLDKTFADHVEDVTRKYTINFMLSDLEATKLLEALSALPNQSTSRKQAKSFLDSKGKDIAVELVKQRERIGYPEISYVTASKQ